MSDVKLTVGGAMEEEASRQFIDAWHRAQCGEAFPPGLKPRVDFDGLCGG
jgi:hypothetical protein